MRTVVTNVDIVEITDTKGFTDCYVKLHDGKLLWLGSGTLENKHISNVRLNLGEELCAV